MAAWVAPLISAGAGLLGKIFGSSSKPQETTSRVDYARMVKDAEAAGFNPLTAIRNGGSAGFSISSTPAAPLSARIADGVSEGVQSFLHNFDPFEDQTREIGFKLAEAQLANLNADTRLKTMSFGSVPSYTGGNKARVMGSGIPASTRVSTAGAVSGFLPNGALAAGTNREIGETTVTNPAPPNIGWQRAPNSVDGEIWETAYGEIVGGIVGGIEGISRDIGFNARRGFDALVPESVSRAIPGTTLTGPYIPPPLAPAKTRAGRYTSSRPSGGINLMPALRPAKSRVGRYDR